MRPVAGQIVSPLAVGAGLGLSNYRQNIILANGVFDLLHVGHVTLLKQAKEIGGLLLVALNSDESVKRIKGDKRPVHSLKDRMTVISSLRCVDLVTWFNEDTPLNLIKSVRPKYLVKGGDYKPETVVGFTEMKEWGGEVKVFALVKGFSSTGILSKL
jgi:rfaE bifunctional protein nucleotidyltransferase chain/domain